MASSDAGTLTNKSKRSSKIYKDLNLDFQQNTATKDIQKMLDVEAVKRSVRNLINLILLKRIGKAFYKRGLTKEKIKSYLIK